MARGMVPEGRPVAKPATADIHRDITGWVRRLHDAGAIPVRAVRLVASVPVGRPEREEGTIGPRLVDGPRNGGSRQQPAAKGTDVRAGRADGMGPVGVEQR